MTASAAPSGTTSTGRARGVLALTAPVLLVFALAVVVDATGLTIASIAEDQLLYEIVLRLPIQLVLWLLLAAVIAGSTASGARHTVILAVTAASVAVAGLGGVVVVAKQDTLSVNDTTALLAAYSRFHVALLAAGGLVGTALVWWLVRRRTRGRARPDTVLVVCLAAAASLVLMGGIAAAATRVVAGEDGAGEFGASMQLLGAADGPALALLVMAVLFRSWTGVSRWADRWLLAAVGCVSGILAASAVERVLDPGTETRFFLTTAETWALLANDTALLVAAITFAWWLIRLRRSDPADGHVPRTDRASRVLGTAAFALVVAAVGAAAIAGGPGSPGGSGTGPLPPPALAERAYVLVGPLTHAFLLVLAATLLPISRNGHQHTPAVVRYAAITVSLVAVGAAGVFAVHALSGGVDTFVLQRQGDRLYIAQLAAIAAASSAFALLTRQGSLRHPSAA